MKTGEKIRAAREAWGLTQHALAAESGMGQAQLSNYERCLIIPTRKVLARIADVLGVPRESLEGEDIERRTR